MKLFAVTFQEDATGTVQKDVEVGRVTGKQHAKQLAKQIGDGLYHLMNHGGGLILEIGVENGVITTLNDHETFYGEPIDRTGTD